MSFSIVYSEDESEIYLQYLAIGNSDPQWVINELRKNREVRLKKSFFFTEKDFLEEKSNLEFGWYMFKFAKRQGEYYKISKDILGTKYNVFFYVNFKVRAKYFVNTQVRTPSIFLNIDRICNEDIYIGGDHESSIPQEDFRLIINNFPTRSETLLYAQSKISRMLREYLVTMKDAESQFQRFLQRKEKNNPVPINKVSLVSRDLYKYEIEKYLFIKEEFQKELKNGNYNEKEWQIFVKQFLLLIFPQYIEIIESVKVPDNHSKGKTTNREIDFVLVNANGCIDIMEIKQPFENCILAKGKYRDNFVPKGMLAGSIMQAEKYIFYLNSYGTRGEDALNKKYKHSLPEHFELRIRNPRAFILIGRSNNFDDRQQSDFEIIKRKYANMIDIISYDDLLNRLENIIAKLESKENAS